MSSKHTEPIAAKTSKWISEVLSIGGMALLLSYVVDAALEYSANGSRIIPLSASDRGIIFGSGALALFIVSNAAAFMSRPRSMLSASLSIAGGIIIGTSVLGSAALPEIKTPESVMTIAVLGFVIAAFGALWIILRNRGRTSPSMKIAR